MKTSAGASKLSAAAYIAKSIDGSQVGKDKETDQDTKLTKTNTGEVMTSNQINGLAKRNQYGEPEKVVKGLLVNILGYVEHVKTRFFERALKCEDEVR